MRFAQRAQIDRAVIESNRDPRNLHPVSHIALGRSVVNAGTNAPSSTIKSKQVSTGSDWPASLEISRMLFPS
jgi:hypothetical protein